MIYNCCLKSCACNPLVMKCKCFKPPAVISAICWMSKGRTLFCFEMVLLHQLLFLHRINHSYRFRIVPVKLGTMLDIHLTCLFDIKSLQCKKTHFIFCYNSMSRKMSIALKTRCSAN